MDKKDTVIEFLMERVLELQARVDFLEKHIDEQNHIILDITQDSAKEKKDI